MELRRGKFCLACGVYYGPYVSKCCSPTSLVDTVEDSRWEKYIARPGIGFYEIPLPTAILYVPEVKEAAKEQLFKNLDADSISRILHTVDDSAKSVLLRLIPQPKKDDVLMRFTLSKRQQLVAMWEVEEQESRKCVVYTEDEHVRGKSQEVIELFRAIDKLCIELDPTKVQKFYRKQTINYSNEQGIFCSLHLCTDGLLVWLQLSYGELENPPEYVRNAYGIGHLGPSAGVELHIDGPQKFQDIKALIQRSFDKVKWKGWIPL